jgi:LmbE family N-acetylglucosaminyl deacetylase
MKKVLVIAAHLDDEILGCGGTLLRHRSQGDTVDVGIVTCAHEPHWSSDDMRKKKQEAQEVDKILGTNRRYYAEFPTVKLNTISSFDLNSRIGKIIEDSNPDVVYTHHEGDINIDHQIVFNSVMVNTRPIKNRIKVCCFETVSSTEWSNKPFTPNLYVNIEGYLEDKIKMFCKYESEVKKFPHPRSPEGLRILASKRGMDICVNHAEAFKVVRDYWK